MPPLNTTEAVGSEAHATHAVHPPPEPLVTIPAAARAIGIHPKTLRRAAKDGLVPSYQPFNSRIYVRTCEILASIDAVRKGTSALTGLESKFPSVSDGHAVLSANASRPSERFRMGGVR